jgi:hypothetical protein
MPPPYPYPYPYPTLLQECPTVAAGEEALSAVGAALDTCRLRVEWVMWAFPAIAER